MQISIFIVAVVILSLIIGNSTSSSHNANELVDLKSRLEKLELQLGHKVEMMEKKMEIHYLKQFNNLSHELKASKTRADQVK